MLEFCFQFALCACVFQDILEDIQVIPYFCTGVFHELSLHFLKTTSLMFESLTFLRKCLYVDISKNKHTQDKQTQYSWTANHSGT